VEGESVVPLLKGASSLKRKEILLECAPSFQTLTNGKIKYIWSVESGDEQLFDMESDPKECHDLTKKEEKQDLLQFWRNKLIKKLHNRPEGFTDGYTLIPGKKYPLE
jgi:arylsulfatase